MASPLHETLVNLFREQPSLALDLAGEKLGLRPGAGVTPELLSGELAQVAAPQARADAVISLVRDGLPVLSIVLEVQLARDPGKRFSWPVYVAGVRARLACPTALVVVTPYRGVAKWARQPIALGPTGDRVRPLVLGPEAIPPVTDPEEAERNLGLALLSALSRSRGEEAVEVAWAVVRAAVARGEETWRLYTDLVLSGLDAPGRAKLEALMDTKYEYQSEYARKYVAQGRAEGRAEGRTEGEAVGKAEALVAVLAARKLPVSEAQRERILACKDLPELDRWIARAAVAATTEEIFVPVA